jgi:hypothetical protein
VAPNNRWLAPTERWLSIAIWFAAAAGIIWGLDQRYWNWKPPWGAELYVAIVTWFSLALSAANAQMWTTRWVNRRNKKNPEFSLLDVPLMGRYLRMEVDLRKPVLKQTIISATRQICASRLAFAVTLSVILFTGSLVLRHFWIFPTACVQVAMAAWEIYPRSHGIRYRTGLLRPDSLVRALCLAAFSRALSGEIRIQDWHRDYFDLIRTPPDGSKAEFSAASWIHTHALLNGDLGTATHYIERHLALLTDDAPLTQYIGLGDALYFYTVVASDESKSKLLVERIQQIHWDLRWNEQYIESAIALASGRKAEALSIAQAELDRIAPKPSTARIQLHRELLTRCRDKAS